MLKLPRKLPTKKAIVQFLKYNVGGFLYFWSAWTIITFGTSWLGAAKAYIIGNVVGLTINYLVQRLWTFGETGKTLLNSGWKFAVLTIANLGIGYVLLQALVHIGIPLWLAQFGNAGFFTVWNWVWYKYWVFKVKQ